MRKRPQPGESALDIRSFSSRGVSSRIYSEKTQRVHHLFSNLELAAFLVAEARSDVYDIQTQAALDIDTYNAIADNLGAPLYPSAFVPTTDLVLYLKRARKPFLEAISCKMSGDLLKSSVLLKLGVEEGYWEKRGDTVFRRVTELDIPEIRVRNLLFIRPFIREGSWLPLLSEEQRYRLLGRLRFIFANDDTCILATLCQRHDEEANLQPGESMAGVRYAIAREIWAVNLDIAVDPALPPEWLAVT